MAITTRSVNAALLMFTLLAVATTPAPASLFTLAASGTISFNTSGDPTIPVGTPWTFELTYDTAAPDLDPDPTSGRFTNTAAPPAMTFFHYRAGTYEVTLDDPADFGTFSGMFITFTSINGIDINIFATDFFPPLAGGPVSFHADFARFTPPPIFSSDALPTNTALGPGSFDDSNVTLLPPNSVVTSSSLTSLMLTAVPPGDYNGDGVVNAADYVVWRKNPGSFPADAYDVWRAHFGQTAGSGSSAGANAAIPEPTTFILTMFAVVGIYARSRCTP
jgi:hypothetical protein